MQKKYKRKLWLTAFIGLCFVAVSVFAVTFLPNRLVSEVMIEAGEFSSLSESQFIRTDDSGTFLEDVKDIDLRMPGEYIVRIDIGFMTYRSKLIIIDTQRPIVTLRQIISPLGKEIKPEDFVLKATDNTRLQYEFIKAPDPNSVGIQEIIIRISDLGNNQVIESSSVLVSQVKEKVTIEAGSEAPILDDFLLEERSNETFITDLDSLDLVV
ncbi:MAG: hypothetical protein KMY54_07420, partial [Erysipelothrix sp.]|nr:hypothetical protein [Erysipelothrix sp.]